MQIPITDLVALTMLIGLLLIFTVVGVLERAYQDKRKKRELDRLRLRFRTGPKLRRSVRT